MKTILSVSLGPAEDDYTVEARLLGQEIQLTRVGTDGDWNRALELTRRSDGQAAAIGVAGIRLQRWKGARRLASRDRRAAAIRATVRASRLADGQRLRPILARRAVAALEAHLNKSGASLEGMQAFLPLSGEAKDLAEHLAAFGCTVASGELYLALGIALPLGQTAAQRLGAVVLRPLAAAGLLRAQRGVLGGRPSRSGQGEPARGWQALLDQVQILAGSSPAHVAAGGASPAGKIVLLEWWGSRPPEELSRQGAGLVVSAGPVVVGHCLEAEAVEALLLALSEKPEAEIGTADLEAAVARIPLRPAVYEPRQPRQAHR